MLFRLIPILSALLVISHTGTVLAQQEELDSPVDFAREILPILSDKCFVCHGPDTRKKDLVRLDSQSGAIRDLGGYRAINPDQPEQSEILVRIYDKDDPMPPVESDKPLSNAERQLLKRWILQGGEYARHWAFVPPVKKHSITDSAAFVTGIDSFIGAELSEKGVDFAPEADPATLARRASLILTGLPLEPERLADFVSDQTENAYGKLVDELLANPRFGEHQARYWLDAVRYGDTHGLHLDNRRGIYPYRDWVVRAFNQNLPLNDFITWQLAGDLLPDPKLEQLVATGFVRMNPTTSEGGAIPREFQAKNNFDRVENLGTSLLGMTLNCARCHNHKYDPIAQEEYYRLMAFFNSTAESSMDGNAYIYGPVTRAPENQEEWDRWVALEQDRDQLLMKADPEIEIRLERMKQHAESTLGWSSSQWKMTKAVAIESPRPEENWENAGGLPGVRRRGNLPGRDKAQWVGFEVEVPIDMVLWLTHSGGPDSLIYIDGIQMPVLPNRQADQRITQVELVLAQGNHKVDIKMAGTLSPTLMEAGLENAWQGLTEHGLWSACSSLNRLRMLSEAQGPLGHVVYHKPARELADRMVVESGDFTTSLIARDLESPRTTQVLRRGEYNLPEGDPLLPGILKVMGAFPADAERNRMGLAEWLTSPDHPLVSRVLVNRIWQRTFGEGLVRSPEDFGLQGEHPTHPDLLDWLAVEFQESGWDLKHMLRLMVTSRTFRQASNWRREVDDPQNRLWARGPGFRLDAEVLRDLSLWASGRLDAQMGGEGVKPYQPGGMWQALAHPASNTKKYERDKGNKLYRRSLYVYWKRTSPHPMMTLFDAPSRESGCVRRSRTNTSLQSLGLFNEVQRLEMSRLLAERLIREKGNDDERLIHLFHLLAGRNPKPLEQTACIELLESMRNKFTQNPDDAESLLSYGDAATDDKLDSVNLASWTQVAVTVLASDIAILVY